MVKSKKVWLLPIAYLSVIIGIPLVLFIAISSTFRVEEDKSAQLNHWQLQTMRVTIHPQGQLILPPYSAFIVDAGSVSLLTYLNLDQAPIQTKPYAAGSSFGTWTGRNYILANRSTREANLIVTQLLYPFAFDLAGSDQPTKFSYNFTSEVLNQTDVGTQEIPTSQELEQIVIEQYKLL